MKRASLLLLLNAALLLPAFAETPALPAPEAQKPAGQSVGQQKAGQKIDTAYVQRQFGPEFTLLPEIEPVFADLDGDGVDDVVIAARCKNPMLDQAEHQYTVSDPYYDFFGYGDPKLTTTFYEADPKRRGLVVLIVYGAGQDAWRSATSKSKYVIVNLPYRTVSVRKMKLGKRTIEAIYIQEASETGESSALFFDGRKFRYVPMGGDME